MHRKIKITTLMIMLSFFALGLMSCGSSLNFKYKKDDSIQSLTATAPTYPETTFLVFSDSHYYDPSLGTNGIAFDDYLANDRKLLAESSELLEVAIEMMTNLEADFVLIPGDLTKDGELIGHQAIASKLAVLEANGIKVYVVPGNHDLNNNAAMSFEDEITTPVEFATEETFTEIYTDYGYGEALYRDDSSLSYVAEPVEGLWLLALDSTIQEGNLERDHTVTDGALDQQTITWIEEMLTQAHQEDKAVIAMLHHGINPHWDGQERMFNEYVIENYEAIGEMFANYNVRTVYTGHYHSQDVSINYYKDNKFLADIETGSLVTYPCPFREISINAEEQIMDIKSHYITEIPSYEGDFSEYAEEFVYDGIHGIALEAIKDFGVPEEQAKFIAPQVTECFVAHYEGDEDPGDKVIYDASGLGLKGKLVMSSRKYVIYGLWSDTEGADNFIKLNLNTGEWERTDQ